MSEQKGLTRAVFLDRDETLNPDPKPGYISNPDNFSLFAGVGPALKKLQDAGFLLIVITNQSGIARGFFDFEGLQKVHDKMNRLLAADGVTLNEVYACPHLAEGKIEPFNIACECRKPKPGLFLKARDKYNIDMRESYGIGDKERDCQAAKEAGARPILIAAEKHPDYPTFAALPAAVDFILAQ